MNVNRNPRPANVTSIQKSDTFDLNSQGETYTKTPRLNQPLDMKMDMNYMIKGDSSNTVTTRPYSSIPKRSEFISNHVSARVNEFQVKQNLLGLTGIQ